MPAYRSSACAVGASPTGAPTSRRSGPASTTPCSAFASTRSTRWSPSCSAPAGCAASTSMQKPRCASPGGAFRRGTRRGPGGTSGPTKAACRTFITGATTCCSPRCTCGCSWDSGSACRGSSHGGFPVAKELRNASIPVAMSPEDVFQYSRRGTVPGDGQAIGPAYDARPQDFALHQRRVKSYQPRVPAKLRLFAGERQIDSLEALPDGVPDGFSQRGRHDAVARPGRVETGVIQIDAVPDGKADP